LHVGDRHGRGAGCRAKGPEGRYTGADRYQNRKNARQRHGRGGGRGWTDDQGHRQEDGGCEQQRGAREGRRGPDGGAEADRSEVRFRQAGHGGDKDRGNENRGNENRGNENRGNEDVANDDRGEIDVGEVHVSEVHISEVHGGETDHEDGGQGGQHDHPRPDQGGAEACDGRPGRQASQGGRRRAEEDLGG
jgi:transcription termination factor Rho